MSEEKTNPAPPIAAQPLLTLDYQRLERARKVAIGGLRLLGILISAITLILFLIFANQLRSMGPASFRFLISLAIMGVAFILGIVKFTCSLFIARRSRTAAIIALLVVLIECLGLLYLLIAIAIHLLNDAGQPFTYNTFIIFLFCCALLGWLAVAYEILQILRLEKSQSLS